jgi:hypothetical protein
MATSPPQSEKETVRQVTEDFELCPWGLVVIPNEVAFICDRTGVRQLSLLPDRDFAIPVSSRE